MEREHGLLLGRLDCREPHRRATHCFANRFRIESIALATLHIRLAEAGPVLGVPTQLLVQ